MAINLVLFLAPFLFLTSLHLLKPSTFLFADTLEIDSVTIRALSPDGSVTHATAHRALANGDASEVQLLGAAHVVRESANAERQVEFDSEFLHAFLAGERLRSHLPVRMRQGTSDLRVGAIDYDNLARSAQLGGPVRARFVLSFLKLPLPLNLKNKLQVKVLL